jgi:hypothetical protein
VFSARSSSPRSKSAPSPTVRRTDWRPTPPFRSTR